MALCFLAGEATSDQLLLNSTFGKPFRRVEMAIPFMVDMVTKTKTYLAFTIGAETMTTAGMIAAGLIHPDQQPSNYDLTEAKIAHRKPSIFHLNHHHNKEPQTHAEPRVRQMSRIKTSSKSGSKHREIPNLNSQGIKQESNKNNEDQRKKPIVSSKNQKRRKGNTAGQEQNANGSKQTTAERWNARNFIHKRSRSPKQSKPIKRKIRRIRTVPLQPLTHYQKDKENPPKLAWVTTTEAAHRQQYEPEKTSIPVSLGTTEKKLLDGQYSTCEAIMRDIMKKRQENMSGDESWAGSTSSFVRINSQIKVNDSRMGHLDQQTKRNLESLRLLMIEEVDDAQTELAEIKNQKNSLADSKGFNQQTARSIRRQSPHTMNTKDQEGSRDQGELKEITDRKSSIRTLQRRSSRLGISQELMQHSNGFKQSLRLGINNHKRSSFDYSILNSSRCFANSPLKQKAETNPVYSVLNRLRKYIDNTRRLTEPEEQASINPRKDSSHIDHCLAQFNRRFDQQLQQFEQRNDTMVRNFLEMANTRREYFQAEGRLITLLKELPREASSLLQN